MRLIGICLLFLASAPLPARGQPALTVYTYSSFTADWGPGPRIERAFEAVCGCNLNFVAVEDGVALLSRLRLEGEHSKADVVLGLDTNLTAEATATGLFAEHGVDTGALALPGGWEDEYFLPYDYGFFAFVYDRTRLQDPPHSLQALVDGPGHHRILIQDPRTSTPGLGLLLWVRSVFGDRAPDVWRRLSERIVTVSKGWSESYGLFLKGEAPLVLSYTTSPAYHRIAEGEDKYAAAAFDEGHYLQVEVAGRLAASSRPGLAADFLQFVLSQAFQSAIPTGNWMYPVVAIEGGLPPAFDSLVDPARVLSFPPEEVARHRSAWVAEWLEALSR